MTAHRIRRTAATAALLVAVAPAMGCATTPSELVRVVDNGMTSGAFEPAVLVVAPGTEVRWRNTGARVQSVASADDADGDAAIPAGAEPWDSGPLPPGEVYAHLFTEPGTYVYRGPAEDSAMVGTVVVEER